jgi:hypothetical protein
MYITKRETTLNTFAIRNARTHAAHNVANRLICEFRKGTLTRSGALTECSKVIDPKIGELAWKFFKREVR